MIYKAKFTKNDYKDIEDNYQITDINCAPRTPRKYYPEGFSLFGIKDSITKTNPTEPYTGTITPPPGVYTLCVDPKGDIPVCWVSGIITNDENPYSAFVSDVNNNPKYKF